MKTRYKNILFFGITGVAVFFGLSFLLFETINPVELTLPRTEYGTIDYVKIGYDASLNDFKSKLDEQNIQYNSSDLIFISGMSLLSDPPHTDYCGYVISGDDDYWYQSSFHKDTLSRNEITKENPMPCKPNVGSCICSLETKITEKYTDNLSFFNSAEQKFVEETVQKFLGRTNMAPGPEKFVVGKYNHQFEEEDIAFCGVFVSELVKTPDPEIILRNNVTKHGYFQGTIRDETKVLGFQGTVDSEKLCAINADVEIIHFKRVNRSE